MDKWTIVRRMKQECGGADFITLTQFCQFMGLKDRYKAKSRYLVGLERIDTKYFIPDVVDRILARKNIA